MTGAGRPPAAGHARTGRRRRIAPLGALAALGALAVLGAPARPATAAFDWEHATPRSLVAGDSPVRWPAAGATAGLSADLVWARPFRWPDLRAVGARVAYGAPGERWVIGAGLSLLDAGAYRESRLALAVGRRFDRQVFALTANVLDAAAGEPVASTRIGGALDLTWDLDLGGVGFAARASGILESAGAVALAAPREFALAVRAGGAPLTAEMKIIDGSRGRRLRFGLMTRILPPLALGAGWSSAEPSLRVAIELRRGPLALGGGVAWHADLPRTDLLSVAHAPAVWDGSASGPAPGSGGGS